MICFVDAGVFQRTNAAVAVAACDMLMRARRGEPLLFPDTATLSPATLEGLASTQFAGRAQIVCGSDASTGCVEARLALPAGVRTTTTTSLPSNVALCLDGAHTERSIREAASWFESLSFVAPAATDVSMLMFNCGHEKDAVELVLPLSVLAFEKVHICPFDMSRPSRVLPPSLSASVAAYLDHRSERDVDYSAADAAGAAIDLPMWDAFAAEPDTLPLPWQNTLAKLWQGVHTDAALQPYRLREFERISARAGRLLPAMVSKAVVPAVYPSIADALRSVIATAQARPSTRFKVFVTGSLYLVGGVLAKIL